MSSLRNTPASPRDEYLDAARACILDLGWRRTTLTEVARRAGVSRMTIYRTWGDMQSLLGDLMTREWAALTAAAVPDVRELTTPDGIAGAAVALVRALRDNEVFARIVELDPELLLPYLIDRRGRAQQAMVELLAGAIAAGQATGALRAGDPEAMARSLVLAGHGFALSAHTMADPEPGDSVSMTSLEDELRLLVGRTVAP